MPSSRLYLYLSPDSHPLSNYLRDMKLRNVSFDAWLASHEHKDPAERWLRELYPWPVLAQVDCDPERVGEVQYIQWDGIEYLATVEWIRWQPSHGTYKHRVLVQSDGLGWHARSWSDRFDLIGTRDYSFVTLFHTNKKEPLEKIARAFFGRQWERIESLPLTSLPVSRFLAATLVAEVALASYGDEIEHYPNATLSPTTSPMLARGTDDLWIGHRFLSEGAFDWARRAANSARQVLALYFADTTYQFRTDLPPNARVRSVMEYDATELGGRYSDLILTLLRKLKLTPPTSPTDLSEIVAGRAPAPPVDLTEADVNEALAVLKRPCSTKPELRYQLAAGVLLNAWIENERRAGFPKRKKFYAFKQRIAALVEWAATTRPPGVHVWYEQTRSGALVFIRVDHVDFSFHSVPFNPALLRESPDGREWRGVRLKPIAPLVLRWARAFSEVQA